MLPKGASNVSAPAEINIDTFFSYPITVKDYAVQYGDKALCLAGKPVRTSVIPAGEVH